MKWKLVALPGMSFVNALPCSLDVEIVQSMSPREVETSSSAPVMDGAMELFFLPDEYYTRYAIAVWC